MTRKKRKTNWKKWPKIKNMDPKSLQNHLSFMAFLLLIIAMLLMDSVSFAQTPPQIIVTWDAESGSEPSSFVGKTMPTANSLINVSFEVIDGGKPADLSKQTIYWYLNNRLIENRVGTQLITITAPSRAPSILELKIELPAYRGGLLLKTIRIPIAAPQIVIEAPYPGGEVAGRTIAVKAVPYFFKAGVSELNFRWAVNGSAPENVENPAELKVNLSPDAPIGSSVGISLTVSNPKNPDESASQNITLKLK